MRRPGDPRHRQVAVRALTPDAPLLKLPDSGRNQHLRSLCPSRPARRADPRALWPEQQPADLASIPVRLADALITGVPEQVRGRRHALPLFGHQRQPFADPRVDDELAWLTLQVAEYRGDRRCRARHYRSRVGVDEPGQLVAVAAAERAHFNR
ncbi:MAG TPA: hypothetical protein VMA72_18000 [Streptosporangiaceae bacterium]|nr:hypothetical protein [Streptosporangiaceae bacterium]